VTPLSTQISALDTSIRIHTGQLPKPSRKEAELLVTRLRDLEASAHFLLRNEAAIKAIDAARREAERQEAA
jgi:hypothetical protein